MAFVQLDPPVAPSSPRPNSAFEKENTQPLWSIALPAVNVQTSVETPTTYTYAQVESSVRTAGLASPTSLIVDEAGFEYMRMRLKAANRVNPRFKRQYQALEALLKNALTGIRTYFFKDVQEVWLGGDDVVKGVNLKRIPYDALVLTIVLKPGVLRGNLYSRISDVAFAHVDASWLLVQFRLVTSDEWRRLVRRTCETGDTASIGYRLLRQA